MTAQHDPEPTVSPAFRLVGTPSAGRLARALRLAAADPRAPRRLQRAADAVLDGKFSWDDAVSGHCAHPYAMSLFTRAAEREMWPAVLNLVEADEPPARRPALPDEDEDFADRTYLRRAR